MKRPQMLRLGAVCVLVVLSLCAKSFALNPCNAAIGISPSGPFPIAANGGTGSYTVGTGANSSGTSCHWETLPLTFVTVSSSSGGGASVFSFPVNFTVSANPNLAPRNQSITVKQTEDSSMATVVVNQAAATGDFSLAVGPPSQNIMQGGTTTYNITISRSGGFAGGISLNYSGPSGTSASLSPNGTTGNSSTLTITAAGSATLGTFPIIVSGTNGNVTHNVSASLVVTPPSTPTPTPTPVPTPTPPSPLTSFVLLDLSSHTIYQNSNQHLIDLFLNGSGIWHSQDLMAAPGAILANVGSGLANTVNAGGCPHVFYIDTNLHFADLYLANITGGCATSWSYQDLTASSAAGNTVFAASPISTVGASNDALQEQFYLGSDLHVNRLYWPSSGGVHNQDLTAATGTPFSKPGKSLTSIVNAGGCPHVFYDDAINHFHDLYLPNIVGGCATGWSQGDLTAMTGNISSPNSNHPFSTVGASNDALQEQFYVAGLSHLWRFYWPASGGVFNQDLTALTGGPQSDFLGGLASIVNAAGDEHIFYLDTNDHVNSLFISGGTWFNQDLTNISGAGNIAAAGSPVTSLGVTVDALQSQFYVGANNHIYRLFWPSTGGVQNQDVTTAVH